MEERMELTLAEPRARADVERGKRLLRGIHHLALVTADMRTTLDFYVRVLGMPLVHALRTPSPPPGAGPAHGAGSPPYKNILHYFLDMGGDSLLAFFEYPREVAKADRDTLGAMQHVSFVCAPRRYREMQTRLNAAGVEVVAGPLLTIPPAIHSFYFFDPNGIRLEIVCDYDGGEEDLQVIRSCAMPKGELRAQLAEISDDQAWIEEMVAAMP
jgi:catechol 2,3-dioxygenase-like lactoylglutathione lyase family enzyme